MAADNKSERTESTNEVVIITGASSGLGRATALEFAEEGYDVVLTARRAGELKDVAKACEKHGINALTVAADATDPAGLQKVADTAMKAFGHIDIWINGAAVAVYAKFLETPIEDFKQVINTNVFGYVYGSRIALEQFKKQGHGTLINIGSVNAVAPVPYSSAYVTSKYAVRGLTDSVRMEMELEGLSSDIHICNVMPASVDTNFFQNTANYTNREVQAIEPVYDPAYVAKHIVKLARHPKREVIIGPAGKMLAKERAWFPKLYEKTVSRFVDANHLGKSPSADTKGNLYEPVKSNTGIYGGWRDRRLRADRLNIAIGAGTLLAGAAAGAYVFAKKRRN
jgi:short-subunit dehydrogenase